MYYWTGQSFFFFFLHMYLKGTHRHTQIGEGEGGEEEEERREGGRGVVWWLTGMGCRVGWEWMGIVDLAPAFLLLIDSPSFVNFLGWGVPTPVLVLANSYLCKVSLPSPRDSRWFRYVSTAFLLYDDDNISVPKIEPLFFFLIYYHFFFFLFFSPFLSALLRKSFRSLSLFFLFLFLFYFIFPNLFSLLEKSIGSYKDLKHGSRGWLS